MTKKELIFVLEYRVPIEENMEPDLSGVLDKMRENGSAKVIDARIEPVQGKRQ